MNKGNLKFDKDFNVVVNSEFIEKGHKNDYDVWQFNLEGEYDGKETNSLTFRVNKEILDKLKDEIYFIYDNYENS
jgi:hypothetical protein